MCKIPDEIILRLKDKDNNLINFLCIRLIFQTNFKNNFLFFVTPRQVVGDKYVIKKMEIISVANKTKNNFPMDYGDILYDFNSKIECYIYTGNELLQFYNSYDISLDILEIKNKDLIKKSAFQTKYLERKNSISSIKIETLAIPNIVSFYIVKSL